MTILMLLNVPTYTLQTITQDPAEPSGAKSREKEESTQSLLNRQSGRLSGGEGSERSVERTQSEIAALCLQTWNS